MSARAQCVGVEQRLGTTIRLLRQRRGLTQRELGIAATVSEATVWRIEHGHLDALSLRRLRQVAAVVDVRVDVVGRWRSGDLDRLVNARHSLLHEAVARWFVAELHDWVTVPEVSFSVYGERGVIDIFGWHSASRAALVIELKTDIADINELVGKVDQKRRLGRRVAADRGWQADSVSAWVILAPSRTNRRRVADHRAMLRGAFPTDGRSVLSWLRAPGRIGSRGGDGSISALSIWPDRHRGKFRSSLAPIRRVRKPRTAIPAAKTGGA